MNKKEIEETIKRYNNRLEQYGISEEALGWGAKGRARLRYEILLSRWDFNGCRILDVGCGFGWFYDYMLASGVAPAGYTGVDINPRFIEIARDAKREGNCEFLLCDILSDKFDLKFDYIVSSGIFNHKLESNTAFIQAMLDKFDNLSECGFGVNFLSNKVKYEYDYTFHADPGDIVNRCFKYSNNVLFRNDYMPFEFTIFVDKVEPVDTDKTVFASYLKYV